jgi:DNA-binding MarR family transcriptional regulator
MTEHPDGIAATGIRLGHLTTDLSFATRILRTQIQERNARFFRAHEAAGGEIAVMSLIAMNPGMTQKDLAQAVVLKKSALTKLVNEMDARGLIERRKECADLRLNALYLTPLGEERLARMRPEMSDLQDAFLSPLSPGERVILFELLWRLIGSMGVTFGNDVEPKP